MKRTMFIALAGIMLFAFTQCADDPKNSKAEEETIKGSKEYRDAYNLLKEFEIAIDKANNCDELTDNIHVFMQKTIALSKTDYQGDTLTKTEDEQLTKTSERLVDAANKKYETLGCDDYGITRRLPPPPVEATTIEKVKERNIMTMVIDSKENLLVNGQPLELSLLKDEVIKFMTPHPNDSTAPEVETKKISVGDKSYIEVVTSKGIISLQNHDNTSYDIYIKVQDQLSLAFNELRNREANRQFGKDYLKLDDDQTKAINDAVPVHVSEAEPLKKQQ